MGYMRHHAIVVTTWSGIEDAHQAASMLGLTVTPVVASPINGYSTFVVVPDGSKEGWADSDLGDAARARFIEWLGTQAYDDGSSPFDWVEVQYGDDDHDQRVVRASRLTPQRGVA